MSEAPVPKIAVSGVQKSFGRKRVLDGVDISCGAGEIDVLEWREGQLKARGGISTRSGARTSVFDPERDRLYLAVPARGSQPAAICIYRPATQQRRRIHVSGANPRVNSWPRLAADRSPRFLRQVRLLERLHEQGQRKYENGQGKQRHDNNASNQGGNHLKLLALRG